MGARRSSMIPALLLLASLSIFKLPCCSRSSSFSYDFSNPDTLDDSDINRQGSASLDGFIDLTLSANNGIIFNKSGRGSYGHLVPLWDEATGEVTSFTTRFSFVIKFNYSGKAKYAPSDGLAFFLSSYPSEMPPFDGGGFLGLFTNNTAMNSSAAAPIVAVEFDTYQNEWDQSSDHIGIDVNSINSTVVKPLPDRSLSNVTEPMVASVSYNNSTRMLAVMLLMAPQDGGKKYELNSTVDFKSLLPAQVAIGFSAASGWSEELRNVLTWSFDSTLVVTAVRARHRSEAISVQPIGDRDERFSEDGKLGEGGFGSVYRGVLSEPAGVHVAVKRISKTSKQGRKEYASEVSIISRLRHRNLAQLVGWCHGRGDFLLVYELVPNGSLDAHLYGGGATLPWPTRYEIALGLGSALLYLHSGYEKCVVHRDIKPSNIMLDSAFAAKLGDFGLAKLVDHGDASQTTAVLAGTMGYMDPEYAASGKASTASDVYSFGIVLLEMCCGRRPVLLQEQSIRSRLLEWVWDLQGRGAILEAADERLRGGELALDAKQMECVLVVGLWCAHPDRGVRPSIKQALAALQFEAPLPALPPTMPVPTYSSSPSLALYCDAAAASSSSSSAGFSSSTSGERSSTSSSAATAESSWLLKHNNRGSEKIVLGNN
uniref:non-specific serine/threonine protein kinase n=1 Tax=Oryza glumipatula TaxID=40148 RepID=A0A0E0ALM1_9ORYZ